MEFIALEKSFLLTVTLVNSTSAFIELIVIYSIKSGANKEATLIDLPIALGWLLNLAWLIVKISSLPLIEAP